MPASGDLEGADLFHAATQDIKKKMNEMGVDDVDDVIADVTQSYVRYEKLNHIFIVQQNSKTKLNLQKPRDC